MAEKQTQDAEFQPSEADGIRMAVIEYRVEGDHEWRLHSLYDIVNEVDRNYLIRRCRNEANKHPEREYRYRRGTLQLDPSDKCEIFRSE